jgi:hypothetical protein
MQFTAQQAEQTGFTRAVGTDQTNFVARIEGDVDLVEKWLDATHERNLLKTNHGNVQQTAIDCGLRISLFNELKMTATICSPKINRYVISVRTLVAYAYATSNDVSCAQSFSRLIVDQVSINLQAINAVDRQ